VHIIPDAQRIVSRRRLMSASHPFLPLALSAA